MTTLVANRLRDGAEIERARLLPGTSSSPRSRLQTPACRRPCAMALGGGPWSRRSANVQPRLEVGCSCARTCRVPCSRRSRVSVGARRPGRGASTWRRSWPRQSSAGTRGAEVLPFADAVRPASVSARHSVMTNAAQLSALGGGGTSVSAPLARLNARQAAGDLVVIVSDNELLVDARPGRATATLRNWPGSARLTRGPGSCSSTSSRRRRRRPSSGRTFSTSAGPPDQVFELVADFAADGFRTATGSIASTRWRCEASGGLAAMCCPAQPRRRKNASGDML